MSNNRIRVMVVEDDHLIASGLALELDRLNVEVVGPFADIHEAIFKIDFVDAAILDVWVGAENAFPLADCLLNHQTPFLFYSGADAQLIPGRYGNVGLFAKPTSGRRLMNHLRTQRRAVPASAEDVVAMLPRLRLEARRLMFDPAAADRLVEATLAIAVRGFGRAAVDEAGVEAALLQLLHREFRRRGRRLMQ